jgi:alanine-glyoxylate transaminase/serine-glyoxylate transaminase/serine-pyruvate transaminase
MHAYEAGKGAYFATPPVNLIYAFHASLTQITKDSPSLEERFQLHRDVSKRIRDTAAELGLKPIPRDPAFASNGLTAIYLPNGVGAGDLLPRLSQRGVIAAGGLHKDIKDTYFRIGHMGISAVDAHRGDIDKVVAALKDSVAEARAANGV